MLVILLFVLFLYQTVKKKRVLIIFLVVMSIFFSYWTYERNKVWKDDLTFWTDIYKKSPDKARVNQYYGKALYAAGRINEAFPIIERALQLYEKQIGSQKIKISYELSTYNLNLGILYKDQGDYQKAIFYLNKSLNIFYYSTTAHYVIGLCYTQIGRYEEAINHLTKAMEFAKHSLTEIDGYSNVAKIEKSLKFAKMALKRQKDREYKLQKNLKR